MYQHYHNNIHNHNHEHQPNHVHNYNHYYHHGQHGFVHHPSSSLSSSTNFIITTAKAPEINGFATVPTTIAATNNNNNNKHRNTNTALISTDNNNLANIKLHNINNNHLESSFNLKNDLLTSYEKQMKNQIGNSPVDYEYSIVNNAIRRTRPDNMKSMFQEIVNRKFYARNYNIEDSRFFLNGLDFKFKFTLNSLRKTDVKAKK